ncbi:cobalamin biosynthesis protein CbiD [[Clostridium] saccharolyticum WM1]|uniref:Cobalt-precorrin-5B C(1)-methyltransferase n=2 Tax=Lacrimispora TaxID=2719231 RepID=D9R4B8_LACSW|nr:cobalamin biosynthesis protein CbiD [[Clostridium] saccharolyticum WM1]
MPESHRQERCRKMEKQELRCGYTTGTCAAVAAKAAAVMLFTGRELQHMNLMMPKGRSADLPLFHVDIKRSEASCAVKKDAGDDPDVTHQAMVFASVQYTDGKKERQAQGIYQLKGQEGKGPLYLKAGEGIGWVTKPGLSCPPGMPAINPVPRDMIFGGVEEARREAGFQGSLTITIWMPEGKSLAEKTFNSRLGIQGGLSILGTTGIVKPMSEDALIATIQLELHIKAVAGMKQVILVPGNYGEAFIRETLGLSLKDGVTCSNFIREALKTAGKEGFRRILFAGHIGKLIKVAGGVPNTHSQYGDRRMEILWDCTAPFSVEKEGIKHKILTANTMEEAAGILKDHGILEPVMGEVMNRIQKHMTLWSEGAEVEVVTFSAMYGILGMSRGAMELIRLFSRPGAEGIEQEV